MAFFTENWKFDMLYIAAGLVGLFFIYAQYVYSYWERKGITTIPKFSYLCGHFKSIFKQTGSFSDLTLDVYKKSTKPFVGIYGIFRPILVIRDPELVRSVLIKDFNSFTDRGVHCNEDYDPLSGHLFALPGEKWKNLRGKLSPTFTSGKLKAMFATLVDCGSSLQQFLESAEKTREMVDIRDLSARYTTNIISSVAFGIEVDTIRDRENDFRKYGRKIVEPSLMNGIRSAINFASPKIMSWLRIHSADRDVEQFLNSIVKQNLEYREKNNVSRKDFFQLLIQLRNNGAIQRDDDWETVINNDEKQKMMSVNEIAAQVFIFFLAGYETSSSTLSFCLYELSKQPKLQERVFNEIDQSLQQNDGKITYDSISEMKYLDNCIDETLRLYPILPLLNRTCKQNYRIPGTNKIIEKGTEIFIPVIGLHRDEQYYPDPEKFIPERFNDENSVGKNQINRPNLGFGDGPRNCIGSRLGKMQTKVGLFMMLQNFRFELEPQKMNETLSFDAKSFLLSPNGGINLRVIKR